VGHYTEIQARVKKLLPQKKAREEKNRFLLNQKPELFVTETINSLLISPGG
jgi:hypothetical protein